MPVSSEYLKRLREVTRAHYLDEIKAARSDMERAAYLLEYWTRALAAVDQLCLEVNVVVEPTAPPAACSLPRES